MAYWMHVTPSPIENILKKESFTLHELLEEDDLVQECKCCNQPLLDFLVRDDTIDQLLKMMTSPDVEHPKAKLYSKKAADVLLCEVNAVTKAIADSATHLTTLLAFLEAPATGDCSGDLALAGHFCRMIMLLSNMFPEETLQAFGASEGLFGKLLSKLALDAFKEMLLPLLQAQSDDPVHLITCWMWEHTVISDLLGILGSTEDLELHRNVCEMLHDLVESRPSVLDELGNTDNVRLLITMLTESSESDKSANLFHVLSGVVSQGKDAVDEFDVTPDTSIGGAPGVIAGAMGTIASLLQQVPDTEIAMPAGVIKPVLGRMRLKCVEFLALVVRAYKTGGAAANIHSEMIEHQVLPCVMQLLFDHPWHNVLHIQVDDIVQHCLYSTNDDLRTALIDQGSLHIKLTEVLELCCKKPGEEDQRAPEKTGNLGCVVGLAQALSEAAENHPCLSSRLEEATCWKDAVSGPLAEELRKQNIELGLQPEMVLVGESSSEEEQHYIHHSSDEEDPDDDPFHGSGVQNRITDAFATPGTTFHDDTDAWTSQPIADGGEWSTSSEWVASFSNDDSGSNGFGNDMSAANDFSLVEDPWADHTPEEIDGASDNNAGWAEGGTFDAAPAFDAGPAWEANFGVSEDAEQPGTAWNACFAGNDSVSPVVTDEAEPAIGTDVVPSGDEVVPEEVITEQVPEEETTSVPEDNAPAGELQEELGDNVGDM